MAKGKDNNGKDESLDKSKKKTVIESDATIADDECCCVCGKKKSEVKLMYRGDFGGNVCDACVEQLHQLNMSIAAQMRGDLKALREDMEDDYLVNLNLEVPTPHEIKQYLDDYVIGQDDAKVTLAVAVYNHYKRIQQRRICEEKGIKFDEDIDIDKANIILAGNSGAGKTLLARTVANLLQVPFAIADATVFTEAGYVGEDVESMITRLLQACDYDVKKAETGLIYLDEADKLGRKSSNPSITRDVNGEGVQQALLKMLEGTEVNVPPQGGRKHPDAPMVKVNTKNILFICGGAFVGIEDIISSRLNTKTVGFELDKDDKDEKIDKENIIKYIDSKDLQKFGFIPELIGRLPIITYVEKLDKDAMKRILTEPKNAIIKQYTKLLAMDGVKLTITDEVYDYIVDKALEKETGARGLRSIVENIMKQIMFDVPTTHVKEVVVDGSYIEMIDKKYKKKDS